MADVLTPEQRKLNMSRIRSRDTKPEMVVRSLVHAMGFRYRLHSKKLPGTPDLVFPKHHKIIFVHGCFFHMHDCHYGKVVPKTNEEFWKVKREGNKARDAENLKGLDDAGWKILIVWECYTKGAKSDTLPEILENFLKNG
jgi:DNA mismatch endonuclease, patch repair protein